MKYAASLEKSSEHPRAAAIVNAAEERNIVLSKITDFQSTTGKGISGNVDGKPVRVQSRKTESSKVDELRNQGQTVVEVFIDDESAGFIGIADRVGRDDF